MLGSEYLRHRDRIFISNDDIRSAEYAAGRVPPGWNLTVSGVFTERLFIKDQVDVSTVVTNLITLLGTNVLATAWELVPYSFVIDWILPIGDYLRNMSSFGGVMNRVSTQSQRNQLVYTYKHESVPGMTAMITFNDYDLQLYNTCELEGFALNTTLTNDQAWDALALSWNIISSIIKKA